MHVSLNLTKLIKMERLFKHEICFSSEIKTALNLIFSSMLIHLVHHHNLPLQCVCGYLLNLLHLRCSLQQLNLDVGKARSHRADDLWDRRPAIAQGEQHFTALRFHSFSSVCFSFFPSLASSLSRSIEPPSFIRESNFSGQISFVCLKWDLWRTCVFLCVRAAPFSCLHVFLMFPNLSSLTAYWQVCLNCQIGVCKMHSADCY